MILAEDGLAATAPVEVKVRRFAPEVGSSSGTLVVDLLGQDPNQPLATTKQNFRWSAGQASARINLDVQIPPEMLSAGTGSAVPGAGGPLTLRASLQSAGEDALPLDNQRYALVELRRRLEVGVIDDAAAPANPGTLRPRDWLSFVLAPPPAKDSGADIRHAIDLIDLAPALTDDLAAARGSMPLWFRGPIY